MRNYIRILRKHTFLKNLVLFLEHSEDNWHIKEELLHLICYLILETKPNEDWFKRAFKDENSVDPKLEILTVNFKEIMLKIAVLLDHKI